jgi:hypothetical protein
MRPRLDERIGLRRANSLEVLVHWPDLKSHWTRTRYQALSDLGGQKITSEFAVIGIKHYRQRPNRRTHSTSERQWDEIRNVTFANLMFLDFRVGVDHVRKTRRDR